MAFFDSFHLSVEEAEKRLGRPLQGQRGGYKTAEVAVIDALNDDKPEAVASLLGRKGDLGQDFIELVEAHIWAAESGGKAYMRTSVDLRHDVWTYYARERRLTGRSLKDLVTEAVDRDHRRQLEASDRIEVLCEELQRFHRAATEILEVTKDERKRLESSADLYQRLRTIESSLREIASWVQAQKEIAAVPDKKRGLFG
jgi:hypothetical protein